MENLLCCFRLVIDHDLGAVGATATGWKIVAALVFYHRLYTSGGIAMRGPGMRDARRRVLAQQHAWPLSSCHVTISRRFSSRMRLTEARPGARFVRRSKQPMFPRAG